MSLWDRISRLWEDFRPAPLDERSTFGLEGEWQAWHSIRQVAPECHLSNVVVPSLQDPRRLKEIDHVVISGGTVFVVEIKNYKGRISWADSQRRDIVQEKYGRYGESITPKPARNPLIQAQDFIAPLKSYLASNGDTRFNRVYMRPVGAFTRNAELASVQDHARGLIYVDELPGFFAAHRNRTKVESTPDWLVRGVERLPRLDVLGDMFGQTHFGILDGCFLELRSAKGDRQQLLWQDLLWLSVNGSPSFLSEESLVAFQLRNGNRHQTGFRHATVSLSLLNGERKRLNLRGLAWIRPSPIRLSMVSERRSE